jgi:S1-C subfamily serine protease
MKAMRQHYEHLAAALGLLAFALFVSYFNTGPIVHVSPAERAASTLKPVASDTGGLATSSLPSFTIPTSTLEALFPTHPTSTEITEKPKTSTAPAPSKTPSQPKATVPQQGTTSSSTSVVSTPAATSSTPSEYAQVGKALVNIICVAHDGSLHSISGSGVFIDSRGIILTVAHVAQSLLLEQYLGRDKVACTIRTGNPARSAYIARPIYVPSAWVKDNDTTLISSQPTGTGEDDYALLAVTASATSAPLPGAFPAVAISTVNAKVDDTVYIGSYGAQTLSSTQVRTSLPPLFAQTTVKDRYTFGGNTIDVLALNGSIASQEGSSGGGVVNAAGELIGLITTSEVTGSYASREMRVIAPAYIFRSYSNETGRNFDDYFGDTSITTLVNNYAPTAVAEGQTIAKAIGLAP